jgi:phosphate transport system protein
VRTEAITLIKEDVLALGQMVNRSIAELTGLLEGDSRANLSFVEEQEEQINRSCLGVEERCLDLLLERQNLAPIEIRTLFASTVIAAKFERMADHANRVARMAQWAAEDEIDIPPELAEMTRVIHRMAEDVLYCFLTDDVDKVPEIIQRDNRIDYLHDMLSKQLLSDIGGQDDAHAQMRTQFLFAARFLERMGDAVTSVAKRVFFIGTGQRYKLEVEE